MDAKTLSKHAAGVVGYMEISYPTFDDADKQAILTAASGIYGARLTLQTLKATITNIFTPRK